LQKYNRLSFITAIFKFGFILLFGSKTLFAVQTQKEAYFGDIHVHTSYDIDSRMNGNTNDPDAAYKFAKGEISIPIAKALNPSPKVKLKISRPLDFVAVTDHAEMMAIDFLCLDKKNLKAHPDIYKSKSCKALRSYKASSLFSEEKELLQAKPQLPKDICSPTNSVCNKASEIRWKEIQKIANKHYEKGVFTTFISYEHTPTTSTHGAFHRNILFRGSSVPKLPLSAYDVSTASALWKKLDETCSQENHCQALVVPHMINVSNGMFFAKKDRQDHTDRQTSPTPYTIADIQRKRRLEPLVEIHQTKGNSECLYGAGTTDEQCKFESKIKRPCKKFDKKNYPDVNCREDSYVRNGLKKGLAIASKNSFNGLNPFEYGFVGGTDNQHGAPGSVEEYNYISAGGLAGLTPKGRLTQQPKKHSKAPIRYTNPGGLTGVWAEENSREAIFDALQQKEVFATSGTRISVRVFASFNYKTDLSQLSDEKMIKEAYKSGVPMGGDFHQNSSVKNTESPNFLVLAKKDSLSANLQRLQIIKGWLDTDGVHEKVYDIACSDGLTPDSSHVCPSNNAKVNIKDCSVSKTEGDSQFKTMWKDPDFNPSQRAFYYVRVLENPTCRWSTYDANKLGISPVDDIPSTIQERAWSSPIWYTPIH
jgi:hypothetical protein